MKLSVNLNPGTGHFEVCDNETPIVSGRIYIPGDPILEIPVYDEQRSSLELEGDENFMQLTSNDVYKELRLRGYDYGKTFQGILSASNKGEYHN